MKILVIGGGGREHALVWKLRQSPRVSAVFCAPGNAGIAQLATCVPIKISDHAALLDFARREEIGLTVVGPDDALAAGLVDHFEDAGLRIFGPRQAAARLESSKVFAKEFMQRHGIPTARSGSFTDAEAARKFVRETPHPLVVKADGLALGKGVIIARRSRGSARRRSTRSWRREGLATREAAWSSRNFSRAKSARSTRWSMAAATCCFPTAQDHKRALDGDAGLNTGGMGTFSPAAKLLTPELDARIRREVLDRFIAGVQADGIDFRGMLFPGLMITADGPKVLEFNCRFGDPETQVLLPRLESDLVDLLEATIDGRLDAVERALERRRRRCA